MGISFKKWLLTKLQDAPVGSDVSCDFLCAWQEWQIRELAFEACVNLIANAIGKCEFKTYRNGDEYKGSEYYLWNIEPNINQNSTAFIHRLIYRLYRDNEALIIPTKTRDGRELLAVADSFSIPAEYPAKMQEYQGVVVGEVSYTKTFKENEVLHFKLNNRDIKPVLDMLNTSYARLVSAAADNYSWQNGKHLKVHVSQIEQGTENWAQNFGEMINSQVKPFLTNENGVLPEFDGYKYEPITSGTGGGDTRDIKALSNDIFEFTARAFGIPSVLLLGDIAGTSDAVNRWLTTCIDPLCDQISEEINRKRYGFGEWQRGNFLKVDTSTIMHFDIFANSASIEKLIGSGAFSINDVLSAAGLVAINADWANAHFMTKNFSTMESQTAILGGGE